MAQQFHNTEEFDSHLKLVSFYQNYPEYLPFIGKSYHKYKILLLGESHYFPEKSFCHKSPEDWYNGSNAMLTCNEQAWINTRRVVNNEHSNSQPKPQKWKKSRTIYRNIESAMIESGFPMTDNLFCHVAYMNAFQRPAEETGESIRVHPIDVEQSIVVINQVIDILKPRSVCFVSSKASKVLANKISIKSDVVSHPASAWWNRESKNGISREKFINLLKHYASLNN